MILTGEIMDGQVITAERIRYGDKYDPVPGLGYEVGPGAVVTLVEVFTDNWIEFLENEPLLEVKPEDDRKTRLAKVRGYQERLVGAARIATAGSEWPPRVYKVVVERIVADFGYLGNSLQGLHWPSLMTSLKEAAAAVKSLGGQVDGSIAATAGPAGSVFLPDLTRPAPVKSESDAQ